MNENAKRLLNYKPKIKAPPGYNILVESDPKAFQILKVGSGELADSKKKEAEKAKA